jgi:hypothetical protein
MVVQIGKPRKELEMDRMEREAPGTPEVPVAELVAEVQQPAQMQQPSAFIDYFVLAAMHYSILATTQGHCGTFAELPAAQQKGLADFVRMCIIQAGRKPK